MQSNSNRLGNTIANLWGRNYNLSKYINCPYANTSLRSLSSSTVIEKFLLKNKKSPLAHLNFSQKLWRVGRFFGPPSS